MTSSNYYFHHNKNLSKTFRKHVSFTFCFPIMCDLQNQLYGFNLLATSFLFNNLFSLQ